jgi:hypothetical protein
MTKPMNLLTPFEVKKLQNQSIAETMNFFKNPEKITTRKEAKSNVLFSQITKRCVSGKILFYPLPASNSLKLKNALSPKRIVAKSSSPLRKGRVREGICFNQTIKGGSSQRSSQRSSR